MFEWDQLHTTFKARLEKESKCTVGRYSDDRPAKFPYVDFALSDMSGGNYDNQGNEGSVTPMIQISVYSTGTLADSICQKISENVRKIMLSYGFRCISGAIPVTNASDAKVKRWVARYQRIFASEDKLQKLH